MMSNLEFARAQARDSKVKLHGPDAFAGMQKAGQLVAEALDLLVEEVRPGVTTDALDAFVFDFAMAHGAIPAPLNYRGFPKSICTSLNHVVCHGIPGPRALKEGDPVLVDGGCGVQGYRSDVTRTVIFGKPTDKQRAVWDIVRKAQAAALKGARPGVKCEDVDAAARKVVEDAGYGPGYKYFAHRVGHGIGMEGHEYPYLVRGNLLKLEPGMTFSNEPGIYIYGEFGIRTEDCMVVTNDGARILGGQEVVSIEQAFADQ